MDEMYIVLTVEKYYNQLIANWKSHDAREANIINTVFVSFNGAWYIVMQEKDKRQQP